MSLFNLFSNHWCTKSAKSKHKYWRERPSHAFPKTVRLPSFWQIVITTAHCCYSSSYKCFVQFLVVTAGPGLVVSWPEQNLRANSQWQKQEEFPNNKWMCKGHDLYCVEVEEAFPLSTVNLRERRKGCCHHPKSKQREGGVHNICINYCKKTKHLEFRALGF